MSSITTSSTLQSIISTCKLDPAKHKTIIEQVSTLLDERKSIAPVNTGMLSGNTKRINALVGPICGFGITFSAPTRSRTASLPATAENLKALQAERASLPSYAQHGRKAALTKQIRSMTLALAAQA